MHVLTRSPQAQTRPDTGRHLRRRGRRLTPEPVDSTILFAPAGELVPPALDHGGTLALASIQLTDIPVLNYQQHLFQERQIRSITTNTRQTVSILALRHRAPPACRDHSVSARPSWALTDLAADRVHGAAVLIP